MMWLFDPTYLLWVVLPGAVLAGWAQMKVHSAFNRASRLRHSRRMTGAEVAQRLLDVSGIDDVTIEPAQGFLSDHYDPTHRVLRLSPPVYRGNSLAAVGVAAHEVGHAIQQAQAYAPLVLRNGIVPMASIGSMLAWPLLVLGIILHMQPLAALGALVFAVVVLFQVINLPVEFNASARARQVLVSTGLVSREEGQEIARVLNAAAMTYVAATIVAFLQLLYFLARAGLLRRD